MTTDIEIDTDLQTHLDARGDFEEVNGDDYLVQRAILQILSVNVGWFGETITPQRAEDYRSSVEERLQTDEEIDVDVRVQITDTADNSVTLAVDLGDQQLILTGP